LSSEVFINFQICQDNNDACIRVLHGAKSYAQELVFCNEMMHSNVSCMSTEVKKTRSSKNDKSEKQQRETEAVSISVSHLFIYLFIYLFIIVEQKEQFTATNM
jgi:hypothetical protein